MRKLLSLLFLLVFSATLAAAQDVTEGTLFAAGKGDVVLGACPLKNTTVKATISGFVARVDVVQEFENSFAEPIEAVYMFPLSNKGAVDSMTMKIGERTISGAIMTREDARKKYDAAKNNGRSAALLDQQRPNVFTQSVANIRPGEKIVIEISYVETLRFEDGSFEFVFPMTVAPRYIPPTMSAEEAAKIKTARPAYRTGQNVSVQVDIEAGVPLGEITSPSHRTVDAKFSASAARASLVVEENMPNKDFVLRYDVTGTSIADAVLTHRENGDGFFTLVLTPPDFPRSEDITPKEIVFVLDSSGSMGGFPIETAKEAIRLSLEGLYPHDTFNVITFAGDTSVLFEKPVAATEANLAKARKFIDSNGAGGGTEMMTAIRAALDPSDSQEHLRIVCFMTDGLVANENQIIAEVQKHPKARVFSFGVGASVNRELLDKIAREGRGEATYVMNFAESRNAAKRFYERVRTPLLTDVSVDFNSLPVSDVFPKTPGDLFGAKPLIVFGRYTGSSSGRIRLRGKVGGLDYSRDIEIQLPENQTANRSLATLWARAKVDELATRGLADATPKARNATEKAITEIGLKYGILTSYTSFVAVDEPYDVGAATTRTADTPLRRLETIVTLQRPPASVYTSGAFNIQTPRIVSAGVVNGKAVNLVKPPFPAAARAVRAQGAVAIQVTIDEKGDVISATAVSGHPLLRAAAIQAANASKFAPTLLSGQPIKVTGVIVYNFDAGDTIVPAGYVIKQDEAPRDLTPAMRAEFDRIQADRAAAAADQNRVAEKLHFRIFALLGVVPAADQRFVASGVAKLEVILHTRTPAAIEKLRAAGFTIEKDDGRTTFTGRLAIENIKAVALLDDVRLILPSF